MKFLLLSLTAAAMSMLVAMPALAGTSPFAGTWKLDQAKSTFTGDTSVYKPLPGGKFAYSYGTTQHYTMVCNGTAFKTDFAGYTGTCMKTGPATYAFTTTINGKLTDKDMVTISADGKTFTDSGTRYLPNGKTKHDGASSTRVGAGMGLGGTWKTAKVSNVHSIIRFTAATTGLTLSNDAYKWKVTMKMDGSKSMVSGPTIPQNAYLITTAAGPKTLHIKFDIGDRTLSEDTMTVSDDGKTLSWMSHAPGNTATTGVYDKE